MYLIHHQRASPLQVMALHNFLTFSSPSNGCSHSIHSTIVWYINLCFHLFILSSVCNVRFKFFRSHFLIIYPIYIYPIFFFYFHWKFPFLQFKIPLFVSKEVVQFLKSKKPLAFGSHIIFRYSFLYLCHLFYRLYK